MFLSCHKRRRQFTLHSVEVVQGVTHDPAHVGIESDDHCGMVQRSGSCFGFAAFAFVFANY